MDANEDVDHPRSQIMHLFNETDLIDLHHHCYPATTKPATHQHGRHPIDIMAGTNLLAVALQHAWMFPFWLPSLIKGNHHMLGLNFDPDLLFKVCLLHWQVQHCTGQQQT